MISVRVRVPLQIIAIVTSKAASNDELCAMICFIVMDEDEVAIKRSEDCGEA